VLFAVGIGNSVTLRLGISSLLLMPHYTAREMSNSCLPGRQIGGPRRQQCGKNIVRRE